MKPITRETRIIMEIHKASKDQKKSISIGTIKAHVQFMIYSITYGDVR